MDTKLFALLWALMQGLPDTAVGDATAAADRAEAAAQAAESHSFGVTDDGSGLILTNLIGG